MKNPNTQAFWNKKIISEKESLIKSPIYIHKNKIVYDFLRNSSGRLLNIGVGIGFLEDLFSKKGSLVKLYGVDMASKAIDKFRKLNKEYYFVLKSTKTPFANNYFDHILLLDVLEHLTTHKIDSTLSEVKRIIKLNGDLIVSVPLNENKLDSEKNGHLRVYTLKELKDILKVHGFKVNNIKYLTAFNKFYYFKYLLNKFLKLRKPNLVILFAKPDK